MCESNALTSAAHALRLPNGARLLMGGERRALVMGILNVTPDSFSDGGLFRDPEAAVAHGEEMAEEGADLIDVGGESTRPGSAGVPPEEQMARVVPVIRRLSNLVKVPLSIDTTSSKVARAALDAGAGLINDVSAMRSDPEMAALAASRRVPVILMHMQGNPRDMQVNPTYQDVVGEVLAFLKERVACAVGAGIPMDQIVVDPGFGFGKRLEHNLALLRNLGVLRSLGRPIMVGTSRKAMIGNVLDVPASERLYGTMATVAAAITRGAEVVRVHDVRPAVHVAKMLAAIEGGIWN